MLTKEVVHVLRAPHASLSFDNLTLTRPTLARLTLETILQLQHGTGNEKSRGLTSKARHDGWLNNVYQSHDQDAPHLLDCSKIRSGTNSLMLQAPLACQSNIHVIERQEICFVCRHNQKGFFRDFLFSLTQSRGFAYFPLELDVSGVEVFDSCFLQKTIWITWFDSSLVIDGWLVICVMVRVNNLQ